FARCAGLTGQPFRPRHTAQAEIQNFLSESADVAPSIARGLPDDLLDPAQNTVGNGSRIAATHEVHFDSEVEGTLNLIGHLLVKVANPGVEVAIEAHRMVEQNIGEFALGQDEVQHTREII